MSYKFKNGKLQRTGGTVKEVITDQPIQEIQNPKHPTDNDIINKIKNVKINDISVDAMEKRLKKFVEFKI